MNNQKSHRHTVNFSPEEINILYQRSKEANMKPTQYMKQQALSPGGDTVLKRQMIKAMSRFYVAVNHMDTAADRKVVKEIGDQLWQFLR